MSGSPLTDGPRPPHTVREPPEQRVNRLIPFEDGTPGPRREMRITDPDGYVLMVAQVEPSG